MYHRCLLISLSFLAIFPRAIGQTEITMVGKFTCSTYPDNQLKFEINLYDNNSIATGVRALNSTDDEIDTCTYTGSGTPASPFRVVSIVNLTNDVETNGCGLRVFTVGNEVNYTWYMRGYQVVNTNTIRQGFILNATCSKTNITDGLVQTLAGLNVPSFTISARYAANQTGDNSFATNSELTATLVLYPDGQNVRPVFQDAKGLSMRNCFSGTDPTVQANRQLFVNSSGCPLTGTDIELTNPPQVRAGTGLSPIIVDAQYFQARNVSGSRIVYIECAIFKCTVVNDPGCINSCNAAANNQASPSAVDTGEVFRTSFIVQDQPVQSLTAVTVAAQGTTTQNVTAGTPIILISKHAPNGVGVVNTLIRTEAVGFYVYNCGYFDIDNGGPSTQFIDDDGCPRSGTDLTASTGFVFLSLVNGVYTIQTGPITPTVSMFRRYRLRCDTGICKAPGHNFCVFQRCNQQNNNVDGAQKLGFQGLEFNISIYNTTTFSGPITVSVVDSDGRTVTPQQTVAVGQPLDTSFTFIPNPEEYPGAVGFYIYDGQATNDAGQSSLFIDENGCRNPDSPYAMSQNCLMDNTIPGVPPYTVSCGPFSPTAVENVTLTYKIGVCYEVNDQKCLDPCAHGPLVAGDTAVATGNSFSRQIQIVPVDDRRTAVRSSEIQTTIIAVTVVAPLVVLGAVAVITYFVVNSQRPKNSVGKRSSNGFYS